MQYTTNQKSPFFQPIEEKFKREAEQIMEAEMKKQGIVLPPNYFKKFDDAYMRIGAMFHQYIVECSI